MLGMKLVQQGGGLFVVLFFSAFGVGEKMLENLFWWTVVQSIAVY